MMVGNRALRLARIALAALAGLALSACDQLAAMGGPTHQYVLQINQDLMADRYGETADVDALVQESIPVLGTRLLAMGVTMHEARQRRSGRLIIDVSGSDTRRAVEWVIGAAPVLEIRMVDTAASQRDTMDGIAPAGSEILPMADGSMAIAVKRTGGLRGASITRAYVTYTADGTQPAITITFDEEGAERLARLTTENVGAPMAIILDDAVISVPTIYEPILGGSVQLAGGFTQESAEEIAIMLSSGSLPNSFTIVEERELD